ncbi:MAG: CaiB/BaiF CoA transferase family protein [Hyphomicrobiaceae bacterium]
MQPLLEGLRIVDITTIILGPLATQILGDMGAEVIKVEAPDGDVNRFNPPLGQADVGAGFANNNRNKRSIAIDLKSEDGKAVLRRLVSSADALVHNMRQDALDRLGFSWEACRALNPKLIYCAALGYGSDGPYSGKPAYDDIIQAAGGIAALTWQRDGKPAYHPTVTADKVAALHVVYAVLAALLHRERTNGQGQLVEMPMFEAISAFCINENLMHSTYEPRGALGYHRTMSPNRKPYPTSDGYIALLPYTTAQWRRVLDALGRDDITSADWFQSHTTRSARSDELYQILSTSLGGRTSAEWLDLFESLDVPCGPVHSLESLLDDPHLAAVDFFEPNFSTETPQVRSLRQPVLWRGLEQKADIVAPHLGGDSRSVLAGLGYSEQEIQKLVETGAVVAAGSKT